MVLVDKFKTDKLEEFKKIEDKTRFTQLFIVIALLNMACVPLLAIFGVELICFMAIFYIFKIATTALSNSSSYSSLFIPSISKDLSSSFTSINL